MFIKINKNTKNKTMKNIKKSIVIQKNENIKCKTIEEKIEYENNCFEEIFLLNLNIYLIKENIKQKDKEYILNKCILNKNQIINLYNNDKNILLYNYQDNFKNLITLEKILFKNNVIVN